MTLPVREEAPPRLDPAQLQVMKLFEIADRLADIFEMLAERVPEGVIYAYNITASTTGAKIVLLYSGTIYNDGAADIYILENDREIRADDTPLKSSESLSIDHKEKGQYTHWIKTLSGTATVRIFALR